MQMQSASWVMEETDVPDKSLIFGILLTNFPTPQAFMKYYSSMHIGRVKSQSLKQPVGWYLSPRMQEQNVSNMVSQRWVQRYGILYQLT